MVEPVRKNLPHGRSIFPVLSLRVYAVQQLTINTQNPELVDSMLTF